MARQAGSAWLDHLAPVLMGLRASIREDSLTSPAELVFGAPLRLPGAFFEPNPLTRPDHDEFVRSLRSNLAAVVPHPVVFHKTESGSIPRSLWSAQAVFLRVDAVRRPLEPPYEGPFEVLARGPKTFTIRRGSKDVVVSVDRLKPAFSAVAGPSVRPSVSAPPPSPRSPVPRLPPPSVPTPSESVLLPPPSSTTVRTRSGRESRPTVRFNVPP